MAQTIWQRYFQSQYDAAVIDPDMRIARPVWITCGVDPHCRAGYALEWPSRCPHCKKSLIIDGGSPLECDIVLVIAEERLPVIPCPYCTRDIPTQRATQDSVERWNDWQFTQIWVAYSDGNRLRVTKWDV